MIFFFLAHCYSAQSCIAVHCSNEGKNFTFNSTIAILFFICSGAKNSFLAPLLLVLLPPFQFLLNQMNHPLIGKVIAILLKQKPINHRWLNLEYHIDIE